MLLILAIILILLFLFGGGWGYSRWGYWSWSPLGLIVLVLLVLWLAGVVHAQEAIGGTAASGLAFLGLGAPPRYPAPNPANGPGPEPTPGPVPPPQPSQPVPVADPDAPPGLSYAASYWIGVVLGLLLVVLGAINAIFIAGHGDTLGLTPQAFAWLSIIGVGLGFLGRFFPNIQHTTNARATEFHRALKGYVPRDALRTMERLHHA